MAADPNPPLTDEALDRLARRRFAEARTRQRDEELTARQTEAAQGSAGDADGGALDWLFGDDAADDAGGGD